MASAAVDRLSADDLMSLHGDAGTVPMQVGGILWLEPGRLPAARLLEHLARRLPATPRLRQLIRTVPAGCGRAVWVDDPGFLLGDHVGEQQVGTDADVEELAVHLLTQRLPSGRPPWAARLAVSADGTVRALVLVVHHVLADGLAALAVLTALADGPEPEADDFPRVEPTRRALLADNLRGRFAGLRRFPTAVLEVGMALRLLAASGLVQPSSLNRPTGESRRLVTVTRDLASFRMAAHANGGSVNDAALAVIAGALRTVLAGRGEDADGFVFSVPFAYHAPGTAVGNASAVMPLRVPAQGTVAERVAAIAIVTAAAKRRPRALGNAILRPVFRLLVRTGWFRRFIDTQRQVNTIVTNVRGPADVLSLAGCPVERIVPLTVATGNITVAFSVFSYAGRLSVTAMADPGTVPDLEQFPQALEVEWDALLAPDLHKL